MSDWFALLFVLLLTFSVCVFTLITGRLLDMYNMIAFLSHHVMYRLSLHLVKRNTWQKACVCRLHPESTTLLFLKAPYAIITSNTLIHMLYNPIQTDAMLPWQRDLIWIRTDPLGATECWIVAFHACLLYTLFFCLVVLHYGWFLMKHSPNLPVLHFAHW